MRYHKKRHYNNNDVDFIKLAIIFFVFGAIGFFIKYQEQIKQYALILLISVIPIFIIYLFTGSNSKGIMSIISWSKNKKRINDDDDNSIIWKLKGMPPAEFEKEVAAMYSRLGYKTETVGQSHDGGVDVIAKKDGDIYLIQCKKKITNVVGVQEARELQGVVDAWHAKKGILINTNRFTPEALNEFKNNPRIELMDMSDLIECYKES